MFNSRLFFEERIMSTQVVKNFSSERICATDGCNKIGQNTGKKRKDGSIMRRKYCSACHSKRTAKKHGLTNIGQVIAKNAGFDNVQHYLKEGLRINLFKEWFL